MRWIKKVISKFRFDDAKNKAQGKHHSHGLIPWLKWLRILIEKLVIPAAGGLLVYLWQMFVAPHLYPAITIIGPPKITTNRQTVSGHFYPEKSDYRVALYVYPEDGTNRYWIQSSSWETFPNGDWFNLACFGNPFGVDMIRRPPLFFKVYAVLIKSRDTARLPAADPRQPWIVITDESTFKDSLKKAGVIAISTPYRVERQPEDICQSSLITTSINGQTLSLGFTLLQVTSPIQLHWEPNMHMYVEIWQGGCLRSGNDLRNNTRLTLDPGVYEFRFRARQEYQCYNTVWIEVLANEQQ